MEYCSETHFKHAGKGPSHSSDTKHGGRAGMNTLGKVFIFRFHLLSSLKHHFLKTHCEPVHLAPKLVSCHLCFVLICQSALSHQTTNQRYRPVFKKFKRSWVLQKLDGESLLIISHVPALTWLIKEISEHFLRTLQAVLSVRCCWAHLRCRWLVGKSKNWTCAQDGVGRLRAIPVTRWKQYGLVLLSTCSRSQAPQQRIKVFLGEMSQGDPSADRLGGPGFPVWTTGFSLLVLNETCESKLVG